jgi:hypothetical protein
MFLAGRAITVEEADTILRVFDGDQLLTGACVSPQNGWPYSRLASPNHPDHHVSSHFA